MSIRTEYKDRIEWTNESGELHRKDGPALEWSNGTKAWFLNGKYHRVDGPAIEYVSGYKAWYLNGEYHRIDGPAIECADGYKAWYLNGKEYSEQDYNKEILKTRLKRLIDEY